MQSYVFEGLTWIAAAMAFVVAVPVGVFCMECALAVVPRRRMGGEAVGRSGKTVVLIAAHNEEPAIATTLQKLQTELAPGDEIVVVADNCSDQTAALARSAGATVFERFDGSLRGKGYALNFGIQELEHRGDPPASVVILDADCEVAPGAIGLLAQQAEQFQRPIQGRNLCEVAGTGEESTRNDASLAALGMCFQNLVRPLGAARLGMPCPLTGTGMALPWSLLRQCQFNGSNLAEDRLLGVDLTLSGNAPLYCPDAGVRSVMPDSRSAFMSQRRRWEHGHLRLALQQIPQLIWSGLRRRRPAVLWIALDLSVPPLALLVVMLLGATLLSGLVPLLGGSVFPLVVMCVQLVLFSTAVLIGWYRFGRELVPLAAFAHVPVYLLRKLPLYASFFLRRGQREWVRTARRGESDASKSSDVPDAHAAGSPIAGSGPETFPRFRVLGVELDPVTVTDALSVITAAANDDRRCILANHNMHSVYLYHTDPLMRRFYEQADCVYIDGMPLVHLGRLAGHSVRAHHRITLLDWFDQLCELAVANNWRLMNVGGRPGVAERGFAKLAERHPGLQTCTQHGYFDIVGPENGEVLRRINDYRPHVLFVGMGMPRQETWIAANLERLQCNTILNCGATLDLLAGVIPTPPRWIGRLSLEWAVRLASDPRRLWRRYLWEPVALAGILGAKTLRTTSADSGVH